MRTFYAPLLLLLGNVSMPRIDSLFFIYRKMIIVLDSRRRDVYSRGVNYELKRSGGGRGRRKSTGETPVQHGDGIRGRDARATPGEGAHQTCHSTKRTQIIFADFLIYHFYFQKLMPFAAAFAIGFVLEKRTQFRGVI
jgi:hypothetical protein